MTITKEMGIMEVVSQYPETVEVFVNAGTLRNSLITSRR